MCMHNVYESGGTGREVTTATVVQETLAAEMRRDPSVVIFGEDVGKEWTPFKAFQGLLGEFGATRVINTPISEPGFAGIAVGAAMTGLRPVVDLMVGDFVTLIMDQMANQAAKIHYMSGGKWKVPLVLHTAMGATRRSAAQHSQSLHALFCHIPGLKVVLPSTPRDTKGLLLSAIRDDNPVIFMENRTLAHVSGQVEEGDFTIPLGVADIKRPGEDVTVVATSSVVPKALQAAELLEKDGISLEVVDPRTLLPLDRKTLIDSARKTRRVIVADEGYEQYGITAELASVISEGAFDRLLSPVKRIGAENVPVPFSPVLEDLTVPTPEKIADMARSLSTRRKSEQ
jgi:pyruvate/2-oxoglutarate/acetoin dehydrogenase E1 component